MGLQARNNSKFLGKIKGLLDRSKTTMLAISQTRANIGGMGDIKMFLLEEILEILFRYEIQNLEI